MDYRTLVTVVRDFEADRDELMSAAAIAQSREAHLTVLCFGIDRTQIGAFYAGADAIAFQQTLAVAQSDAGEVHEKVSAALKDWPISWEALKMTAQIGAVGPVVSDFTRLADLTIVSKPYGDERGAEDVAIVEGALFGSRTPVLVLPEKHSGDVQPKCIAIAWNESHEALAAVRAAMPLLKKARSVDIAIIDPPSHGADRSDPGGALAEMLARHGVRADISVLAKTMPNVSDVICRHVRDIGADMIVMGAYGHSRFREAILGGATRNMLEMAEVPVLMSR